MKRLLLLIGVLIFAGAVVFADFESTTLPVSARLLSVLSVSTTTLDFGTWEVDDTVNVATATVSVQAAAGTSFAITLDAGQHHDGLFWRYVQNGAYQVPYLIFDPTGSFVWGDGGYVSSYPRGSAVHGVGNGSPQSFTAEGFLFAQFADPESLFGMYTDSVTVTVYY